MKTPFVTREQLESLTQEFPTPFHLYDEAGIRETARALHQAFAWNEGFKEYFAIKATPNPSILKILVGKKSCFLLTTRQLMNLSMREN